ncbi:alpha/beta fold hydrolase [Microbulbifer agarilyticus]
MTGADSIQGLAQDFLASLPPRFALAGFSMGGIVALEMLRQAPERIAGLALLDTNYQADQPERAEARDAQVLAVMRDGVGDVVRKHLLPNYFAAANREDPVLAQTVIDMAEAVGELAFVRQARALGTRCDGLELLQEFSPPALLLCGDEDVICPVELHQDMATVMPQSDLVVVKNAGHMTPLEQPESVSEAMGAWLQKVIAKEVEQ